MAAQRVSTNRKQDGGMDAVQTVANIKGLNKNTQRGTRRSDATKKGSSNDQRLSERSDVSKALTSQVENAEGQEVQIQKAHTQRQVSMPGQTISTTFDDVAILISGTLAYSAGLGTRPPPA